MPPVVMAGLTGNEAKLDELIKAGADLNATGGSMANTALHMAAENGHLGCVRKLLAAHGEGAAAAKSLKNNYDMTPADCAEENEHDEIVDLLQEDEGDMEDEEDEEDMEDEEDEGADEEEEEGLQRGARAGGSVIHHPGDDEEFGEAAYDEHVE